jgi:uncharacterized protein (DUF983 family)
MARGAHTLMPDETEGPVRWPPPKFEPAAPPMPSWGVALTRGLAMRCPACGRAGIFRGFITVRPVCPRCGAPLGRVRLELLPSYLTILLGLWVMGAIMFAVARLWHPRLLPFLLVFIPICVLFELAVVRPVRGVVLAAMLKMNVLRANGAPE